jgi:DNA-binding MarR family transcriptional regulator
MPPPAPAARGAFGTPGSDQQLAHLASELRVVLGRTIRRLRMEYRFGLTQVAVLGRLDREGPMSTGELARAERVRPQSMSQTLADLEAEGLVSRTPDERDGRRTLVALTETGREALEHDRMAREGWLAQALAGFTPDEQDTLQRAIGLLSRITEQ